MLSTNYKLKQNFKIMWELIFYQTATIDVHQLILSILSFDTTDVDGAYHVIDGSRCRVLVIRAVGPATIVHDSATGIPLIGALAVPKAKKLPTTLRVKASREIDVGRFGQDMVVTFAERTGFAEDVVFFQTRFVLLVTAVLVRENHNWLAIVDTFCAGNQPALGRRLRKGIDGIAGLELGANPSKRNVHFVGIVVCHLVVFVVC